VNKDELKKHKVIIFFLLNFKKKKNRILGLHQKEENFE